MSAKHAGESDQALIARVVANDDRAAFRSLVDRHQGAVRNVLRRLARTDSGVADDLAQATFLRAYLTLEQFRGGSELRTWLYRIACNEYFQYRRSARHRREVSLDDPDQVMQSSEDVTSHDEQSVRTIDVERAMQTLNDAEREAIVICYYADLSHVEAAEMLQCPLGTLKSNISRGKVKLQQALAAWAPARMEAR
jgi:RNA polymerase sigma-70 factor (ECF subfamily)